MSDLPSEMQPDLPDMASVIQALDAWKDGVAPTAFPLHEVLGAYLALGKHFVPETLTDRLATARTHNGMDDRLRSFLDAALDKRDGCYEYGSYCALEVLGLPDGDLAGLSMSEIDRQRDLSLLALVGDLAAFEMNALNGNAPLPVMRPDSALAEKRVSRSIASLRPTLRRLGWRTAQMPTFDEAAAILAWRDRMLADDWQERIEMSLLPVSIVHDEYMFLRILQAFEANFAWIAVLLRRAIWSMQGDGAVALSCLQGANRFQREASRLFPLLGTMQIAAFHDFRRFTEGASAIQSAGYKTVEALCRRPDDERLDSVAYATVPDVRAAVRSGQGTLDDAFAAACRDATFRDAHRAPVSAEMDEFAAQLMRWRQAHYQIAKRFLGDRGGTGYTEGVPYLDRVRGVPVFREIVRER